VESVGVAFFPRFPVAALDGVFIGIKLGQSGDKKLPHADRHFFHRAFPMRPFVELADDRYLFGIGGPNAEDHALFPFARVEMRTHKIIGTAIVPLMEEIQVVLNVG
jgi:hypothetical protein